jgi:outer membrane lipoprotein-sorting protein
MSILLLALLAPACAEASAGRQDDAKAKDLLKAAADALKEAPAVSYKLKVSSYGSDIGQDSVVMLKRPNLVRMEMGDDLMILDGKNLCL